MISFIRGAGRRLQTRYGNSIKCPHIYKALRRKGYSKTKSAKISNAKCKRGRGRGC